MRRRDCQGLAQGLSRNCCAVAYCQIGAADCLDCTAANGHGDCLAIFIPVRHLTIYRADSIVSKCWLMWKHSGYLPGQIYHAYVVHWQTQVVIRFLFAHRRKCFQYLQPCNILLFFFCLFQNLVALKRSGFEREKFLAEYQSLWALFITHVFGLFGDL